MSTTLSQLICKLQQLRKDRGNLEVIVEPYIDEIADSCNTSQVAWDAIHNELEPIQTRIVEAQSDRNPDQPQDDNVDYAFDCWQEPVDAKKLVVISSGYFKFIQIDNLVNKHLRT